MERIHRSQSPKPLGWHWPLFWVCLLLMDIPGGTNVRSRYATLKALVEDHTFAINAYHTDTADWARTPDGTYLSNKAPGPVLIALPFFWFWDGVTTRWWIEDRGERDERRDDLTHVTLKLLALLFQILPLALLIRLAETRLRAPPLVWATLGVGTTAGLFLNNYFGHGMAAVWGLAAALALGIGRIRLAGFALGVGVLCDYSVALLLLPAALWIGRRRGLTDLALGGLAPLAVFVAYHWTYFGAPWALPMRYQNPEFVDVSGGLWGVLNGLPRPGALLELLGGPSRGLLWTAPWVFVLPWLARRHRSVGWGLLGLVLLLGLNSAFGAWHGGHTSGPRYLSPLLPTLVLLVAVTWKSLSFRWQSALAVTLSVGLAVQLGVFLTGTMAPPGVPLWAALGSGAWSGTALLRGTALFIVMGLWVIRLSRVRRQTPTSHWGESRHQPPGDRSPVPGES